MPLHGGDYASMRAAWLRLRREARQHTGPDRVWRLRAARQIDLLMHGYGWSA